MDRVVDKTKVLEFVEILESGKYKQTKETLHNPEENSFCCLGVLCDTNDRKFDSLFRDGSGTWVDKVPSTVTSENYAFARGFFGESKLGGVLTDSYINMNDLGKSFVEIAAKIRKDFGLTGVVGNVSVDK